MVERKNYLNANANASVCVCVCVDSRGRLRGAKMLIDSGAGDDGNYDKRQCYIARWIAEEHFIFVLFSLLVLHFRHFTSLYP